MNLRQERQSRKLTIPELSQLTRIEQSVLRDYEFNGTPITKNHEYRFKAVFSYPKTFYGMSEGEANMFVEWKLKQNETAQK